MLMEYPLGIVFILEIKSFQNIKGKKISITLETQSNITGYQVRYSEKSNMKEAKSKTSKKSKIVLIRLKKKKIYYIQARAYSNVSGTKKYGSWSKKVKVKINK